MIAFMKKALPEYELTVLVNPGARSLLENNPAVQQVLVIDKKGIHRGPAGMLKMIRDIRKSKFDLLLSPHQSHRTSLLALFSGIGKRHGYRSAGLSLFAYTHRLHRPPVKPEIERLLQFLNEALGVDIERASRRPLLFESESSQKEATLLLSSLSIPSRPILMAPSSVWPTKRWTPWGFAELAGQLIRHFKCQVLLVGSKEDYPVAEEVRRYAEMMHPAVIEEKITNVCGETSLLGLYSLMKRSRLLVSNDSAPVHFACAAGIPVTAIFGPTVTGLGYAPIAPRTGVVENNELDCRPCGTHGGNSCPRGHFRCMKEITARQVFDHVLKMGP